MKRLNYYQVHKNKKPINREIKINFNKVYTLLGLSTIISSMELAKITTNPLLSRTEKAVKIFNSVLNQSKTITNILKDQKKQRYLNRIKK